ncbi:hypothetical protein BDZ45DRAFT_268213 [Acephala macrosclerotiorum]|nr:hypothetical protein BDZ45DRAFT_268213 [Acephala macrosclerotiorum]
MNSQFISPSTDSDMPFCNWKTIPQAISAICRYWYQDQRSTHRFITVYVFRCALCATVCIISIPIRNSHPVFDA